MVIMIHLLKKLLMIGQIMFRSSNRVETYQAITKDGETIFVHGFSYQHDTSYENKIDEYPSSQGKKVFILECYTVLIVNLQLKIAILNLF